MFSPISNAPFWTAWKEPCIEPLLSIAKISALPFPFFSGFSSFSSLPMS
jgi:hypothetical protein